MAHLGGQARRLSPRLSRVSDISVIDRRIQGEPDRYWPDVFALATRRGFRGDTHAATSNIHFRCIFFIAWRRSKINI
jgi:hypothetical protein